jgi:glycogen synthase
MTKRVLITADAMGGVFTFVVELARALDPLDVELVVATMGRAPDSAQRRTLLSCRNVALHVSEYRLEWMEGPWSDVDRAGEWLLDLERRCAPDVVHSNGYAHGALPFVAPKLVVGHSCVSSWWEAVHRCALPDEWSIYATRVREGLAAADLVVAPTAWMLEALQRHHGPLARTRVIANGRSPERFPPARKLPFVFSAGRLWDEAKNVAVLARIAHRLPWPLRIAGDTTGPDGRPDPGLRAANVEPLGVLGEHAMADVLARASIYVHPARYEPFGLAPLEAALSGCALVLADLPSLRESWGARPGDPECARFVDEGDPDALAAAITTLIDDPSTRASLAASARRRALEFSPERTALAYRAAYDDLVAGRMRCAS